MKKIPISKGSIKGFIQDLSSGAGVYKFLNSSKEILYIGKAKNIKKRVLSYFQDNSNKSRKLINLLKESVFLEIALTNNELEALLLEQHLIKENKPKFNVQFKDDKGYPWIKIENSEDYPAARSYLGKKNKKDKFFGPFPSSYALKGTLNLLQKNFQIRNCSSSFFKNRSRPCIQHDIGRCSAPCVGLISKNEYMNDLKSAELLLLGKSEELISEFYAQMDNYSKNKDYEKAAIYRDKISSLRDIQRTQSVMGYSKETDAISLCTYNGKNRLGITHVSDGWVTGHENFIQGNNNNLDSVLESFIKIHYLNEVFCPSKIILGKLIRNKEMLEKALSKYHKKEVKIITKPGKKDFGLLQICEANTKYSFAKNVNNKKDALPAMISLSKELKVSKVINLIESYDISHHSGSAAVAGCVVYGTKGKLKEKYRLFNISKKNSGNDIASMIEVLERRFKNKNLDLDYPDLIVIDGGKTHLNQVLKKLKYMNLKGISVISISKGIRRKKEMDLIHLKDELPIQIQPTSLAHLFLQEIRDETHRYSVSKQKKKIMKISMNSSLDQLDGVGHKRKKLLIRYFGSVKQVERAGIQDLVNVPGVGKKTALSIYNQLH